MEYEKHFFRRSNLLIVFYIVCLVFFVGILYDAQIVHGADYRSESTTQITTTQKVKTFRGKVTDRNGKVLVSNRQVYTVSFDPDLVADEAEGELTTCAQENLTGVRVVRAFGRERFESDRFARKNERFSALWVRLGKVLSIYWASGVFLVCLQIMSVIVAGTVAAVNGSITLGDFQAFVIYNSAMAWPVRSLGRVLSDMSKAGVSLDRVGYILQAGEEKDGPQAKAARLSGDIVFDHVTFGYEGQEVLRDVSFTIPWGSTFAILGGTGSGKSTLVHLLDRLYDLEEGQGKITVGGTDIRDISREELRRQIGLVLQEPFLFSQTIRENIAAARPSAPEEELRACAGVACVDDAISELAQGYDTIVGERGVTLSGGQKQRVAIARMLLQNAPVMVFDDSLSAVDAETDAKIRAALKERVAEATVILISHRVTTLMQADRILVLKSAHILMDGTPAEVFAHYRELEEVGLAAPQVTYLMHELRKRGIPANGVATTLEEAKQSIMQAFSEKYSEQKATHWQ